MTFLSLIVRSEAYVSIQKWRRNPHGVVEQSIGTIPLTKKERDEIAKEERRRMNQKLEAQNERYQIIRSTQRIIPIEDIYGGIVVTKDHRYIKIMEFRPINFAYMDAETQNRIISLFYQTFKATPAISSSKPFLVKLMSRIQSRP